MKQAIVLGFHTRSKNETGEVLFLGSDKDAAKTAVNDPAGGYVRKELYLLAIPGKRRCFEVEETVSTKDTKVTKKK